LGRLFFDHALECVRALAHGARRQLGYPETLHQNQAYNVDANGATLLPS